MLGRLRYHWQRLSNRRYLRAERRLRPHGDFSNDAAKARSSNFAKGGFFTK
jgi:hypothetical protein